MATIPPLRAQQSALHTTLSAMNREISQLNDLQSLLNSNETILHQAMRDADQVMEDAKHRKVPSVDDVLVAPTVVARQLYELVADETSLEECRGVVGRALDRGRIGGDVWAKVSDVLITQLETMHGKDEE
jgi:ESCRT-I complex subunit TSG101